MSFFFSNIQARHTSQTRLHVLKQLLLLAPVLIFANFAAKAQEPIELFLPLSSANPHSKIPNFQTELNKHGLANINVNFADHWHDFQQGLRLGKQGIYLAPPHFGAWAINQHNFIPLLKIAEPLSYIISVRRSQTNLFEINDLVNHKVCSMQPLEMDYLFLVEAFRDKFGSVYNQFLEDVVSEMTLEKSNCDGFVVSNHYLRQLDHDEQQNYIRLHQSPSYNNHVFVAHPSIDSALITKLSDFLARSDIQLLLQPILKRYANNTSLIPARKQDYPVSYTSNLQNYWNEFSNVINETQD